MIERITTEYPDFDDLKYTVNQLVDAVNAIQKEREAERFEIQEWIGILEAVRESVNVHEKQIDELQIKVEPHKCEPAENSQSAKIAQDPYEKERKALEIAVDALKDNLSQANFNQMLDASRFHCIRTKCELALEQIAALEQKD